MLTESKLIVAMQFLVVHVFDVRDLYLYLELLFILSLGTMRLLMFLIFARCGQ